MEYSNEYERGELELLRAKMLMSVGRRREAEDSLAVAENVFRGLNEKDKLSDVMIVKSQMHLCQNRVSLALNDIQDALFIVEGTVSLAKEGQILFYRGLAFLAMGKENEAHNDLSKYVEIAAILNDDHAQVLGSFYHALAFERHREPCMASAEIEIAKDLLKERDPSLKGRLNAFLAHLWIRRGQMGEAEPLITEALKLISWDRGRVGATNMGMAFLVWAEVLAIKNRREEGDITFDQSVQVFRTSRYGLYFEALALAWYGETLLNLGREEGGRAILSRARDIYQGMTNESQVIKIDVILAQSKVKLEPSPGG
jgi:tetratricopeptide (TPR) repeat protein